MINQAGHVIFTVPIGGRGGGLVLLCSDGVWIFVFTPLSSLTSETDFCKAFYNNNNNNNNAFYFMAPFKTPKVTSQANTSHYIKQKHTTNSVHIQVKYSRDSIIHIIKKPE